VAREKNVGLVLRQARIDAGLSVRALERLSGVTTALISKLEAGDRPDPSFRTIQRLATAIGISLDELVRRSGGGSAATSPSGDAVLKARLIAELERAAKAADGTKAAIESALGVLRPTTAKKIGRRRST